MELKTSNEKRETSNRWVSCADPSGFGSCTNHGECEAACPKNISIDFIAMMNRDYLLAKFKNRALMGQRS